MSNRYTKEYYWHPILRCWLVRFATPRKPSWILPLSVCFLFLLAGTGPYLYRAIVGG